MRIAVMGAGGVGGYFGARLAHAGHDVAFVARGRASRRDARARAVRQERAGRPAPAEADRDRRSGDARAGSMSSSSRSSSGTPSLRRPRIKPLLAAGGVVIPFQNGVESIERIGAVDRARAGDGRGGVHRREDRRAGRDRAHGHDGAAAYSARYCRRNKGPRTSCLAACKAAGVDRRDRRRHPPGAVGEVRASSSRCRG